MIVHLLPCDLFLPEDVSSPSCRAPNLKVPKLDEGTVQLLEMVVAI